MGRRAVAVSRAVAPEADREVVRVSCRCAGRHVGRIVRARSRYRAVHERAADALSRVGASAEADASALNVAWLRLAGNHDCCAGVARGTVRQAGGRYARRSAVTRARVAEHSSGALRVAGAEAITTRRVGRAHRVGEPPPGADETSATCARTRRRPTRSRAQRLGGGSVAHGETGGTGAFALSLFVRLGGVVLADIHADGG